MLEMSRRLCGSAKRLYDETSSTRVRLHGHKRPRSVDETHRKGKRTAAVKEARSKNVGRAAIAEYVGSQKPAIRAAVSVRTTLTTPIGVQDEAPR